jgi:asparagine synthase (glutamine-hydrolysing)
VCGLFFSCNAKAGFDQLCALNAIMLHRGPDSTGHYHKPPYFLGFNRLSILDLSADADQPFFSRSGKHVAVFNGEIYNYRELVKKHGLNMRTTGDTELLVELYERDGEKMLGELNGMFACVILNTETGALFAARDRLGVKPLYIYERDSVLAMASEIAPLVDLAGTSAIDEIGLRQYKKLRTFFGGHTLFKNITAFPAAHYCKDGKLVRYWDLPIGDKLPPTDEELLELVNSSIAYRCISDVPVGSFLSGGLDSSIVTMVARPSSTWSIGFSDANEFEWAKIVARAIDSEHHDILVSDEEFLSTARDMILTRREPLSVPNEVLIYLMARQMKKQSKVVLCGEGADELFFGYDRIFRWAASQKHFDLVEFDSHYSYVKEVDLDILESVIDPFVKAQATPLGIVAHFFQIAHLHGLLRRLDNSTMLASMEAREPFVDYRLIETMAGVGIDYRMKDGVVKAPLKRIFTSLLPAETIARTKVGFPVPLSRIFNRPDYSAAFDAWFNFNLETLGIQN